MCGSCVPELLPVYTSLYCGSIDSLRVISFFAMSPYQ